MSLPLFVRYCQPLLCGISVLLSASFGVPVLAQSLIVPDDTLGAEQSQVQQNVDIDGLPSELIQGGATRGQNLFHSFSEFNVDAGRGAYFDNPAGIANIFGRVTGNNASNILGTLGVDGGDADLFLINPNGILFGSNASLDLEGSFAATTADEIQFGEQGLFSADNPEVPSQLLTVDPSAFFSVRGLSCRCLMVSNCYCWEAMSRSMAVAWMLGVGEWILGLWVEPVQSA